MTVDDFLRSVIVALEEQTEQTDETPKKEEQTDETPKKEKHADETPKKEETSERKKLSNAEFLTATLRFGIGEDGAELLDKLIRDATPSNMEELFSLDEQDKDKNDDDNTVEEKELIEVKNQLEMTRADVVELKRIIANLRDSNSSLANVNQELRIENHNLRIENEAMAKQCDSLSQELKRVKGDCDALRDAAQIIVKYLLKAFYSILKATNENLKMCHYQIWSDDEIAFIASL